MHPHMNFLSVSTFQFQVNRLLTESGSLYILQLSAVAIKLLK